MHYLVLKAIEGHVYPGTVGRFETPHAELGETISNLLERDGYLVKRQAETATEPESSET